MDIIILSACDYDMLTSMWSAVLAVPTSQNGRNNATKSIDVTEFFRRVKLFLKRALNKT